MPGPKQNIPIDEAQGLILSSVHPLDVEEVSLIDALGLFLTADVFAPRPAPPFDNSAMDGFAIVHPGAADAHPMRFAIVGTATAGGRWHGTLAAGEALRIMTGAPLPAGADTVVMREVCKEVGPTGRSPSAGGVDRVDILEMPARGANIRRAGEDIHAGEVALRAGACIGPVETAALASVGRATASVRRRPRVAILSTGNELVEPGGAATGDTIYNSNAHALCAFVATLGAVPVRLGIARDTPGAVGEVLQNAPRFDVLLTTGGVSVGEFDYVKESLRALGCRDVFWRVLMRPGRPAFFGMMGDRPVFGLPGNAVSCMVTFTVLAAPAIRAMAGDPAPIPAPRAAVLSASVVKKSGLAYFTRARVCWRDGTLVAVPASGQGSHQVFGQRGANALVIAPPDRDAIKAGETVQVIPFGVLPWTADW